MNGNIRCCFAFLLNNRMSKVTDFLKKLKESANMAYTPMEPSAPMPHEEELPDIEFTVDAGLPAQAPCQASAYPTPIPQARVSERELEQNFIDGTNILNKLVQQTAIIPASINFQYKQITVHFPDSDREEVFTFSEIQGFCGERDEDVKKYAEDGLSQVSKKSEKNNKSSKTQGKMENDENQETGVPGQFNPGQIQDIENKLKQTEALQAALGQDPTKDPKNLEARKRINDVKTSLGKAAQTAQLQGVETPLKNLETQAKAAAASAVQKPSATNKAVVPQVPTTQTAETSMKNTMQSAAGVLKTNEKEQKNKIVSAAGTKKAKTK